MSTFTSHTSVLLVVQLLVMFCYFYLGDISKYFLHHCLLETAKVIFRKLVTPLLPCVFSDLSVDGWSLSVQPLDVILLLPVHH